MGGDDHVLLSDLFHRFGEKCLTFVVGEKSAVEVVRERLKMSKSRDNAVRRFRRSLDKPPVECTDRDRDVPLGWFCDTFEECLEQHGSVHCIDRSVVERRTSSDSLDTDLSNSTGSDPELQANNEFVSIDIRLEMVVLVFNSSLIVDEIDGTRWPRIVVRKKVFTSSLNV